MGKFQQNVSRFLVNITIVALLLSTEGYSKPKGKRSCKKVSVNPVKGTVLLRHPLSSNWHESASAFEVNMGALMQILPGNAVRVTRFGRGCIKPVDNILINRSMVVRLDRDLFRKVSREHHFLSELEDLNKEEAQEVALLSFESAWNRIYVFFDGKQIPDAMIKESIEATKEMDILEGITEETIRFASPLAQAAQYRDIPYEVDLNWIGSNNIDGPFRVLVEKIKGGKNESTFIDVENNRHKLILNNPGRYQIQVVHKESGARSPVKSVEIFDKKNALEKKDSEKPVYGFFLIPPQDKSQLYRADSDGKVDLYFSWSYFAELQPDFYKITFTRKNATSETKIEAAEEFATVTLTPGEYLMQIVAVYESRVNDIASELMHIMILPHAASQRDVLDSVFDADQSGMVFLNP